MWKKLFEHKIIGYVLNFLISATIDIGIYTIIFNILVKIFRVDIENSLIISTVIARILSSICNFYLNKKLFVKDKEKTKGYFIKYYILWFIVLISSSNLVTVVYKNIIQNEVIAKAITDISIGIFSYLTQRLWVFKSDKTGIFFNTVAFICKISTRTKCEIDKKEFEEPKVFIGHHQNFYAPIKSFSYLPKTVHTWTISHLFTFKECYDKYQKYTFRKIPNIVSAPISCFLAIFIPAILRSANAIPVYRGKKEISKTFEESMKVLEKNHQIIIFPDVKYESTKDEIEKIYTGFFKLEEYYYNKTNKHLKFVPIIFDKKNNKIALSKALMFEDSVDMKIQKEEMEKNIIKALKNM